MNEQNSVLKQVYQELEKCNTNEAMDMNKNLNLAIKEINHYSRGADFQNSLVSHELDAMLSELRTELQSCKAYLRNVGYRKSVDSNQFNDTVRNVRSNVRNAQSVANDWSSKSWDTLEEEEPGILSLIHI